MSSRFMDRRHAGRALAERLRALRGRPDVLVLALPRGGVPVAYEVARALDAPLDVFLVRKLGLPGHDELAMGAIATGGVRVFNDEVVEDYRVDDQTLENVMIAEERELSRRDRVYRGARPPPHITGQIVLLVDDGLATGSTMRAAVAAVREQDPARVIVTTPVAAPGSWRLLGDEVDDIVCVAMPDPFHAVGAWYGDFRQTSDEEVRSLLTRAEAERASATVNELDMYGA